MFHTISKNILKIDYSLQQSIGIDIDGLGIVESGGYRPITPSIDIPVTTEITTDFTETYITETELIKPITPSPSNVIIIIKIINKLICLLSN